MAFSDNLKTLPPVNHLSAIELLDSQSRPVGRIENKPGQAGSLAVYAALADDQGRIDVESARRGLTLYAEHTADAQAFPGKHPNIDRLAAVVDSGSTLQVRLIPA